MEMPAIPPSRMKFGTKKRDKEIAINKDPMVISKKGFSLLIMLNK